MRALRRGTKDAYLKTAATDFSIASAGATSLIVGLTAIALITPLFASAVWHTPYFFLITQDLLLVPIVLLASWGRAQCQPNGVDRETFVRERLFLSVAVVSVLAICWGGHYVIMRGLDLSRDELLVLFDSAIFSNLSLAAPIPEFWRRFPDALNQQFILPIGSAEMWVSAYLPVNAAFHAAIGRFLDDDLTSPLFVAAGAVSLWRVALLLWPDDPQTRTVSLLLYFGSSQIVITGMTKYAMSAHMALNLTWLWLFLLNRAWSHLLALCVAFLATGLHQPVFHPMFAAPFVLLLAVRRQWSWLFAYGMSYALIGAFWLQWPSALAGMSPNPPGFGTEGAAVSYLERLIENFSAVNWLSFWLTALNLLRFVTWQHPMLLVLMIFGAWKWWKSELIVRSLTASLVLPIIALLILVPLQGHGWGYRYLHPAIGSAMLLGGFGWSALRQDYSTIKRHFVWASVAAICFLLPLHAVMAHQSTNQFHKSEKTIANLDSDFAIIDGSQTELIYNSPYLTNRPIRLLASKIPADQIKYLCAGRTITFVDGSTPSPRSAHQKLLKLAADEAGCEHETVEVWMGLLNRWLTPGG